MCIWRNNQNFQMALQDQEEPLMCGYKNFTAKLLQRPRGGLLTPQQHLDQPVINHTKDGSVKTQWTVFLLPTRENMFMHTPKYVFGELFLLTEKDGMLLNLMWDRVSRFQRRTDFCLELFRTMHSKLNGIASLQEASVTL